MMRKLFAVWSILLALAGPAAAQTYNGGYSAPPVPFITCPANQFVSAIAATGNTCLPISAGMITGLAAIATSGSASDLIVGTVPAARGGAGTIAGALKGNGAGVVSQAACADLSNGAASCSTDTTNATNISAGTLAALRLPAFGSGDVSFAAAGGAGTLATVNSNVGTFGSSTAIPSFTVDGKGRITAASNSAAPTSYFVSTTGNDSNNCTSSGTACLTVLKAVQRAQGEIRSGCSSIAITIAAGTYTTTTIPTGLIINGSAWGCNSLSIVGNAATPSSVVLASTASPAILVTNGAIVNLSGLKFTTSTGASLAGIQANNGANVTLTAFDMGTTTGSQFQADGAGTNVTLFATGVSNVTGSATDFAHVTTGAFFHAASGAITFTTPISYANYFIGASENATSKWEVITFTNPGNVTTPSLRYFIHTGAMVNIGGGGSLTFFPGTTIGLTSEGGIYDTFLAVGQATGTLPIANGGTGVASGSLPLLSAPVSVSLSVAADTAITIPLPSGYTRIGNVQVILSGASGNASTATFGIFTATGGGGTAIFSAGTAITVTTSTDNTNNNMQFSNQTAGNIQSITPIGNTVYFRVGTTVAQTINAQLSYKPLP